MNNEALKQFTNRIDELENRIDTIEERKSKGGYGLIGLVRDLGLFVALSAGILGAAGTVKEHLDKQRAKPEIQSNLGQDLNLSLTQDGQLDLDCELILNNVGDAKDIVNVKQAYIKSYVVGDREPFNLEDIRVSKEGARISSITVKADEIDRVNIISSSKLTPEKQPTFFETGNHELVLELHLQKSGQSRTETYCFWQEEPSVEDLRNKGKMRFLDQDKGCPSGYQ
jgi:hypothetical protein